MENEIVNSLFKYKDILVPIIGEEMFVYVNEENIEIPLQNYIVDYFKDKIGFDSDDEAIYGTEENLLEEMKTQGYYGMTLLYNHFSASRSLTNAFKEALATFYEINHERIHLKKIVKRFLLQSHYPLVITTSPFVTIEKDLHYSSSIFFDAQIGSDDTIIESETCVYHLFGPKKTIGVDYYTSLQTGDYVTNENELLTFLHAINKNRPAKLAEYLQHKFLLVLGCCLPNWFFRFLLYPIRNTGKVFLINNEMTSKKMNYYLHCIGYTKSCDLDGILRSLTERMELEVQESYECSVFLSIAYEDMESASIFKEMMESEFHIKVWVFSEEIISGNSKLKIKEKFQKSKYFVPFITDNYIRKISGNSGLKECLEEFGMERLKYEKERGNYDFVQPVLKDGTKWNGTLVTPKVLSEWAKCSLTLFHTILNGSKTQIHTYKGKANNNQTLVECLDSNGYKVFENLLKNH